MVKAIIALLTALLVAVPVAWQWSKARTVKKADKAHEDRKKAIRKAITEGDIDKVRRQLARWLCVVIVLLFCFGCQPKIVFLPAEEAQPVTAGVPFVAPADGWWLSNDDLAKLLDRLEDLQYQLDSQPKADRIMDHDSGVVRQYGVNLQGNLLVEMGQSPDDSARPLGSMANNPGGDNHNPQVPYQAETVGLSRLSNWACGRETGTTERLDLDSHIGLPSGRWME